MSIFGGRVDRVVDRLSGVPTPRNLMESSIDRIPHITPAQRIVKDNSDLLTLAAGAGASAGAGGGAEGAATSDGGAMDMGVGLEDVFGDMSGVDSFNALLNNTFEGIFGDAASAAQGLGETGVGVGGTGGAAGTSAVPSAPDAGFNPSNVSGTSTDPNKFLFEQPGKMPPAQHAPGAFEATTGAGGETTFTPSDVAPQAQGIISSKMQEQLALGTTLGVGNYFTQRDVMQDKIKADNEMQAQRTQDTKDLEEWKRRFIRGGSFFDAKLPFRPRAAGAPASAGTPALRRPDGSAVWNQGLISSAMGG